MDNPDIVEWVGGGESGQKCMYCGKSDTYMSEGMWAHTLTVQNYQDLIDRGWRRHGKFCYKANAKEMCCSQYTIRCEALKFQLNKSHKKVIKQFNKYIIHGKKKGECSKRDGREKVMAGVETKPGPDEDSPVDPSNTLQKENGPSQNLPEDTGDLKQNKTDSDKKNKTPKPGDGADPTKPKCQKAKAMRKARRTAKLYYNDPEGNKSDDVVENRTFTMERKVSTEKTLEEFLDEYKTAEKCVHRFEIRLLRSAPCSQEFQQSFKAAHNVYQSYQTQIHGDLTFHPGEKQYTEFLVTSPLVELHKEGGLPMGYGSFHQQYIIDGKIIAVGVIDILPYCTSSVYLYYDPDYNFLSLGTYSTLQEIAFTRFLHKMDPALQYYYMGYYIHSCQKAKYKGQYHPSYLLCPETYSWHPIKECAPKLDRNKYTRFAPEEDVDDDGEVNLLEVGIIYKQEAMTYELYRDVKKNANDEEEVKTYAKHVGRQCAKRMLLYRSEN